MRFRILFVYSDSSSKSVYAKNDEDVARQVTEELNKVLVRGWSLVIHISNLDETEPKQL